MPLANFSQSDHSGNSWSKNLIVSFELPRYAAKKLHHLAISGDRHLKEVGVIKVEIRELTDEWNRVKQDSDAKKLAHFQKHQAFIPRPVPGASNSAQAFPWQHQQAPLQFTYYTSQQPQQQQLVRDKTNVRLYSLPTNDKGEYKTKIIGISRGVLTDESIPVDSNAQEAVPSWLIESSLCISFRKHGKCDVACQTGSEKIMYRPRPSSFRYDGPPQLQPGSTGLLLDGNGRYKVYGNSVPYQRDAEKSSLPREPVKRQCSSESIRILESLANSLVTAEEKAGEAVSGAYPLSKKSQQEVRGKASDFVRSEPRLMSPPADKVGNGFQPPMNIYDRQTEYQELLRNDLSCLQTSQEAVYRQPEYVSREEALWPRRMPKDNVGTVKGSRNSSHAKRPSKKEENRKHEAMTSSNQVRGPSEKIFAEKDQAQRHSHAQSISQETKVTENSVTGLVERKLEMQERRTVGYDIPPEKDVRQSLAGQLVNSEDKFVEPHVAKGVSRHLGNVDDTSQGGAEQRAIPGDKSIWEGSTSSSFVLLDNIGRSLDNYDVKGGSLPISVTLDSSYLQGISARGSDGKYRRPVVKEEPSEKVIFSQQSESSNVLGITTQVAGTGTKRKRRKSSKSETNSSQMAPSEPAKRDEVAPSEPTKRKRRRPSRVKSDVVDTAGAHARQLETSSGSQALDSKNGTAMEGILRKFAVEDMKSKAADKIEANTSQRVIEYDAEAKLASSEVELQDKEAPIPNSIDDGIDRDDLVHSVEIMQKESVDDNKRNEELSRKHKPAIHDFASVQSSSVRVKEDDAETMSKEGSNALLRVPTDGVAPTETAPTSSSNILLEKTDSLTSGQPASPSEADIKIRPRSQRFHQKAGIHREIEEYYFHSYRSVACETDQLLPDDVYYGENYPIVFADEDEISMKFVDMSTAFKLAMKGRLPMNYSSRDEKRGFKPVAKTKPQQDLLKRDTSLYEKTLRKRASIENRPSTENKPGKTKQRSSDHGGDAALVAEKGMRRSIDEEELNVKPSHQMSLRPRRSTKAIEDDYLSSDSLEGDDTEPDTGSLYESDESSDSEPLINKIKNSGKIRERLGKHTESIPKKSISSDDDGDSDIRLRSLSWKSGASGELKRSESVSTTESDTFDLIPPKKKSLPESRASVPQAAVTDELKYEREVHSNIGALSNTAATNSVAEVTKDYPYKKDIYVPSDSLQNDKGLMPEGRAATLGVYTSDHKMETSAEIDMMTQTKSTEEIEDGNIHMPTTARGIKREDLARRSVGSSVEKQNAEQDRSTIDMESTVSPSRPLALKCGSTLTQIGCTEANKELSTMGDQSVPTEQSSHTRTENAEGISRFDDSRKGGENSTLRAENVNKTEPSEETDATMANSCISDRSADMALTITTADTVKVDCEIHSQIVNNSIQRPRKEDGSHDEAASVGKAHSGGSFITKFLKKGIQKISHTLGKGKEQVFKETKGAMQNSTAGGYVEVFTPRNKRKSRHESGLAQSTGQKDGEEGLHPLSCQTAIDVKNSIDFIGSSTSSGDEVDTPLTRGSLAGSIGNDDNKVMPTDNKIGECVGDDEKIKVEVFGRTSSCQELPEDTEAYGKVDDENNNDDQLSVAERKAAGVGEVGLDSLGEVVEALHDRPHKECTTRGGDIDKEEQNVHKAGCISSNCTSGSQPLPNAETEQNISYHSTLGRQPSLPLTVEMGEIADTHTVECRPRLPTDEFTAEQGLEALCEAACIKIEKNRFEAIVLKDGGGTSTEALPTAHISNDLKEKPTALTEDDTSPSVDNAADRYFGAVKQAVQSAKNLVESEEVSKGQICEGEEMLPVSIKSVSANPRISAELVPKEGVISSGSRDSSGNACSTFSHDSGLSTICDKALNEVEANKDMPCKDVVDGFGTTERSNIECDARDIEPECSNTVDSGMDENNGRNPLPVDGEEKKLEGVVRIKQLSPSKFETVMKVEDADQLMQNNRIRREHFDAADLVEAQEANVIEVKGDLHLGKRDKGDISECASQTTSAGDENIIEEREESETVGLLEKKSINLETEVGVEKDLKSGKCRKLNENIELRIESEGDDLDTGEVLEEDRIEKGVDVFSEDRRTLAEIEEVKSPNSASANVAKGKSTIGSDGCLEIIGEAEKEEVVNDEDLIEKQKENESKKQCADNSNDKRGQNIAEGIKDNGKKEFTRSEESSKEGTVQESSRVTKGSSSELDLEEDVSHEHCDRSQESCVLSKESCSVSHDSSGVSQESIDVSQESIDVSQESSVMSQESCDTNGMGAGINDITEKIDVKINTEHEKSIILNVDMKRNPSNSMVTSKRQRPEQEGETSAPKMLKLDVADGEVDVKVKLVPQKDCSRDGNGIGNKEDCNTEIKEGCSDVSSKVRALKAGDRTLSKIDTNMHTGSDKALNEKTGNKNELSVVYEHSETREEILSSTNPKQIADGRTKDCSNLRVIEVVEPAFGTKHQDSYAGSAEGQVTLQTSNQMVAVDNCLLKDPTLEVRVELTDALECIRQYQESSDEESVASTSIDGEVADFTKNIERQSDGSSESYATLNEAESGGSTGTGQEEQERQVSSSFPDSRDKGAGVLIVRSRRNSTTESDARPRSDKPKRRKSAADSDVTDGSRIVLTRRMRRESVGSPAKRLRSSKS